MSLGDHRLLQPAPRRIAVFRALNVGDLLCTVPALRALRNAAPRSRITLVGLPWSQQFAQRYAHLIDDCLEYPLGEELPERPADDPRLSTFIEQARQRRFGLTIQMHGSGTRSNAVALALGAPLLAGFHASETAVPEPGLLRWREDEHEIRRWLRLMSHLGADGANEAIELPVSEDESAEAASLLDELRVQQRPLICVHGGARLPSRRWPVERFGKVAEHFARAGYAILLTGSAGERELVRELHAHLEVPADAVVVDTAGRTTLGSLAALLQRSALLICNDTGISHVAAATRTPSLVISSGGDARRWAPLASERHRVLSRELDCRPCLHEVCPIGHPCALAIETEQVIAQAQALLDSRRLPIAAQLASVAEL